MKNRATLVVRLVKLLLNDGTKSRMIYRRHNLQVKELVIDDEDIMSFENTLAPLVYAMLLKLQENDVSFGAVDNSDVPVDLRNMNEYDYDRWQWLLNELIWTFEQVTLEAPVYREPGTLFEGSVDLTEEYERRIQNGYQLFGKYLATLWT